ncbi:MAG: succinate dehydrogenase, hydrophobic membrane anchor protein [Kordiimonas sp.]|nr:succinate dehydrogenase, hydrophobic membrane anchor protein [Kordiimonas sp.]|tara:strand:- start:1107 stop:1478 length:372 start_codon:yes stop_codon:yes gene_type:complete
MSLQTPLGRVRGLGSAKSGTHHWWMQRVTAVALVPLALWFVASLVCMVNADYQAAVDWLSNPLVALLMLLFVVTGLYHLKLGMQVIIEDYLHGWMHVAGMMAMNFGIVILTLGSVLAILKVFL